MPNAFEQLGVSQRLAELIHRNGLHTPTPVQKEAIPVLLSGKDAIVQAQTGTGKTLAFLLPIFEKMDTARPDVQAVILTPTRELAIQITAEARKLAAATGAGVLPVYGGQDVEAQIRKLKGGIRLVVATPGRLLDHLRRGSIQLGRVSQFILDEADQMLAMGFMEEVGAIINHIPADRQMMLFSATLPGAVRRLAAAYMAQPADIRIRSERITLDFIQQLVVETTDRGRQATLFHLIGQYRPFLAVIFCRTKIRAKKLTEALIANGFDADELHGDLSQAKREAVMKRFREVKLQLLVATDVAARGIDVEGVTHVFNYDVPADADSYIHRIGRTGRAGQRGMAVTFVSPKDRATLQTIEQGIGEKIERRRMDEFGIGTGVSSGGKKPVGAPVGRAKIAGTGARPSATASGKKPREAGSRRGNREKRQPFGKGSGPRGRKGR